MEPTTKKPKVKKKEQVEEKPPVVIEKKKKVNVFFVPYITTSWKGVIDIHTCVECGFYTESKDEIIIHVIEHLPQAERPAALDYLMEA